MMSRSGAGIATFRAWPTCRPPVHLFRRRISSVPPIPAAATGCWSSCAAARASGAIVVGPRKRTFTGFAGSCYSTTGGILGIIMMRLVIGQLLALVEHYPALVDGAFVIIGWVGFKLLVEYLHSAGYIALEIPKWLSLGLIVVIFAIALGYSMMTEKKGERS